MPTFAVAVDYLPATDLDAFVERLRSSWRSRVRHVQPFGGLPLDRLASAVVSSRRRDVRLPGDFLLDDEVADTLPDGWRHWLQFEKAKAAAGTNRYDDEIPALEADQGRYLGFVRMLRRRPA